MSEHVGPTEGSRLMDASPLQLGSVLAFKAASAGAHQTRRALSALPTAAARALRPARGRRRKWPLARAAQRGYSFASTDSKWSLLCYRCLASSVSVGSVLSLGSVASLGSAGSLLSIGSAGSILSIGSAGSILSIGATGSVGRIGGVNRRPSTGAGSDRTGDNPTLTVIDHGGTLLGILSILGAARATVAVP